MRRMLQLAAALLEYPSAELQSHRRELREVVEGAGGLRAETRAGLLALLQELTETDLMDAQAHYVGLFDRSRSLSLHLFEHVHGESRDRGQALVDLLEHYRAAGLEPETIELPDYLPLFLEFLAQRPEDEALDWLMEIEHLLQLLHGRLEERDSGWQWVFAALIEAAGLEQADEALRRRLRQEAPDDTPEALDEVWAEEPVTFGPTAGGGCSGAQTHQGQTVPVQWTDFRTRGVEGR